MVDENVDDAGSREKPDKGPPDVTNLLSALNHERDNRRKAKQELAALREQVDGIDIDLARKLLEKHAQEERAKLDVDTQVNEKLAGHLKVKDQTIEQLEGKVKALESRLKDMFFQGDIARMARDQNVREEAVELVIDRAMKIFKLEEDGYIPYENDKVIYGKDGTKPMSPNEFIESLTQSMPFLRQGNKGGAVARSNGVDTGGAGAIDFSKMSAADLLKQGRRQRT